MSSEPAQQPQPQPQKVLIIGGTGRFGPDLIREALKNGHQVRATTRDLKKAKQYEEGNVEWQQCDALEHECMTKAMSGRDAVISSIGPKGLGKTTTYSESMKMILRTMEENRVRRLLCVSSEWDSKAISGFTKRALLLFLGNIKADMLRMEDVVAGADTSKINWTCVRTFRHKKDPGTGNYRVGPSDLTPIFKPETRYQDLAHFLVKEMVEKKWSNSFVTIGY